MAWRDPGYYDYLPYNETRPRITWPNGARVAFWGSGEAYLSHIGETRAGGPY